MYFYRRYGVCAVMEYMRSGLLFPFYRLQAMTHELLMRQDREAGSTVKRVCPGNDGGGGQCAAGGDNMISAAKGISALLRRSISELPWRSVRPVIALADCGKMNRYHDRRTGKGSGTSILSGEPCSETIHNHRILADRVFYCSIQLITYSTI